mmetsp:Transcript_71289/g.190337  ORF Transcript_71289/g.190337 Transcript_71289/m.190337 type:complete len:83 (+) Transcript_71289:1127-1375(+)
MRVFRGVGRLTEHIYLHSLLFRKNRAWLTRPAIALCRSVCMVYPTGVLLSRRIGLADIAARPVLEIGWELHARNLAFQCRCG